MMTEYCMANLLVTVIFGFIVLLVFLVFFSIVMRWLRNLADRDEHYCFVEIGALRKTAEVLGIDVGYEKKLLAMNDRKTFRRKLEERIIADTFGDDEPKPKPKKEK